MNRFFLDPHVHLHPQVSLKDFLDTAIGNFQTQGKARTTDRCGLVLTEVHGTDSFEARLMTEETPDWQKAPSNSTITAERSDGWQLTLWPGRQLVSSEGLEVLALGPMPDLPDKTRSTAELISAVLDAGAHTLLPWGVGKWTATRWQRVDQLLRDFPALAVADNGNRLRGTALPRRLRTARDEIASADDFDHTVVNDDLNACVDEIERILAARPAPVLPLALTGMWESMWSRRDSRLGRARLPRRLRARIGLVAGQLADGNSATAAGLEAQVRALRGEQA